MTQRRRIWLLTGEPGSGKSAALSRIILGVRSEGFTVGGMLTREIRSRGEREGFRIENVATGESDILASAKTPVGPKIGKYRVSLNSLSGFAVKALEYAIIHSDFVVCDEVGPMELLSPEFRRAVQSAIAGTKPLLCVVHKSYSDPLIEKLRSSPDAVEEEITFENRELVPVEMQKDIIRFLSSADKK